MFDTAKWASGRGNATEENVRSGMIAGLADANVVPGASRAETHAVLGEPDTVSGDREVYALGRGSYAPDYETLVIEYDATGKVLSVIQHQS